jgi:hypothetical protein
VPRGLHTALQHPAGTMALACHMLVMCTWDLLVPYHMWAWICLYILLPTTHFTTPGARGWVPSSRAPG